MAPAFSCLHSLNEIASTCCMASIRNADVIVGRINELFQPFGIPLCLSFSISAVDI